MSSRAGATLIFDPVAHVHAGVVQLSIARMIKVKAFGLITTRLPDGSKGYSLLVFITVEDFQPIQLGLGFTLRGIGGISGSIARSTRTALREGWRAAR